MFAAEANTEIVDVTNLEYVFNNGAHGISQALADEINANKAEGAADVTLNGLRGLKSGYHTIERTDTSISSGRWGFVNIRTSSGHSTNSQNTVWHIKQDTDVRPMFTRGTSLPEGDSAVSMAIAFEIEVTKKGTYQPSLTFMKYGASPKFEVYLIEKPETQSEVDLWHHDAAGGEAFWSSVSAVSANDYVGTVDFWGDYTADDNSAIYTNSEDLKLVDLEKGVYYLVLVANGTNDNYALENHTNGNKYIRTKLHSFALKECVDTTELTYDTTLNAFNTDKMATNSSSSYYYTPGYLRSETLLMSTTAMNWETWAEVDKDGNAVTEETKYKTMNLGVTDPWSYFAQNGSMRIDSGVGGMSMSTAVGGYQSGKSGNFLVLRLRVPRPGKYKLQIATGYQSAAGAVPAVYFYKDDGTLATGTEKNAFTSGQTALGYFDFSKPTAGTYTDFVEVDVAEAGDYFIAFVPNKTSRVLNPNVYNGTSDTATYKQIVSIADLVDADGNIIAWEMYSEKTGTTTENYTSGLPVEKTVTIDEVATTKLVTATYSQYLYLAGIKLVPVEDADYEAKKTEYAADKAAYAAAQNVDKGEVEAVAAPSTATISLASADINGKAVSGAEVTGGGTYNVNESVTVSANTPTGYRFSHWAVGADGMLVSAEAEYTFNAGSSTKLTAIYIPAAAEDTTTVIYYNADGAEISRENIALGADITLPEYPTINGGEVTGWKATNGSAYSAGDTVKASGSAMVFVADFEAETYTITTNNGTISNASPKYGEKVTVVANARETLNGGGSFNYWQDENGEILSFSESYSFYAWGDRTLTAVYKEFEPVDKALRKIILSEDGSYTMAEFIGIDASDTIERGILFGTNLSTFSAKAVMKTDAKQFIIDNDSGAAAVGYAILKSGEVIYSK